jgi:asparagine synthase (glutamine-hydrolysing)
MCGICGIALSDRSSRVLSASLLEGMRDTLTHRGPDGAGLHLDGRVGLGHRRLSIIDVAGGAQPMLSDSGRHVVTYNGEIYNHLALKAELEAEGVHYHTRCDTETVLHLVERSGTAAAARLRGMFAFAIWDRATEELLLVRDRLGVKPLYYVHAPDGSLYFASEIKALLAAGATKPTLNRRALPSHLASRAVMGEETLFEGIRRVPPGHQLRWRAGEVQIERYWDLSFANVIDDGRPDSQWVDDFESRFEDSVRMRLMSDVPLGMFLSGGIDSAAITAAMSRMVDDPIKTFSVAFEARDANELSYARLVAERYRTDHHEVVLGRGEFFDLLPRMIWHEDEPLAHPSSIPLFAVSRLAAAHVKVVLTGEGSDENLAGYPWYRATMINQRWGARYAQALPAGARSAIRSLIGSGALPAAVRHKLRRTFLYLPADLDTILYDNFSAFSRLRQRSLLTPALREELAGVDPYIAMHAASAGSGAQTDLSRLLAADIKTYLHELLMKQDQMSMAASIESRVPFLDHPFVEFIATMPDRLKLRGLTTKYVLRQAMRDKLPAPILSRRKMGFPVPLRSWFRGPQGGILEEVVLGARAGERGLFDMTEVRRLVNEHRSGAAHHEDRLWVLLNFELWQRMFIDGEGWAALHPPRVGQPQLAVA